MESQRNSDGPKVLVIGGGVSGSAVARTLRDNGIAVQVWDKGRGAGGRLSTRRTATGSFNHGTTVFKARNDTIGQEIEDWQDAGLIETVAEGGVTLIRARGAMNGLVKHLHRDLEVHFQRHVVAVNPALSRWRAMTDTGYLEYFDHIAIAIPAPQVSALVAADSSMLSPLSQIRYAPAWVVLISGDAAPVVPLDHPDVERIEETFGGVCVHLTVAASLRHVESSSEEVLALFGLPAHRPAYLSAHRWRYSQVDTTIEERFLTDDNGLVACGDGFGGAGVEAALVSGKSAANYLLERIASD